MNVFIYLSPPPPHPKPTHKLNRLPGLKQDKEKILGSCAGVGWGGVWWERPLSHQKS